MELKKAARQQVKLKLNISAPSGAGKTYGALLMAKGLVGDWDKVAVIDTENSSASLYDHLGEFNVIDLKPPFSPERYIEALRMCIAGGIQCIIIDSSTHEWSGPGGCIESNEALAQGKYRGNTWSAWNETTPRHDAFITEVLQCPAHVITCTRSKTETVMGEDKKVKKVGMKDMQREGWEYELTVSLNIDRDSHLTIPSKDRTGIFEGGQPFKITEETGRQIKAWCEKGIHIPVLEEKPMITDKMFGQLLERLGNGELDIMEKAKETYTLSEDQKNKAEAVALSILEPPVETTMPDAIQQAEQPSTPAAIELPEITAKMFDQLISRYKIGENEVISKAKEKYSFSEAQKEITKNIAIAKRANGVFNGDKIAISESEFRSLIKLLKSNGVTALIDPRKFFTFTPANEEYINKVILSLTKKAA